MARPNAIALLTDQQGPGGKRRPLCRQRLEDWRTLEWREVAIMPA